MAVYKVPQDVEAEDKLIGPFGFRQFIYLIIAALGMLMGYLLGRIFVGLAIIPLPVIALFLVLALPLRKDQPMETYLVAVVNFFLKPRQRMWQPDGATGLVQITAPHTIEQRLTKDFGGDEAAQRLSYLAQVVDSRGWSTRGVATTGTVADGMIDDIAAEAQSVEDVLDADTNVSRSFDSRLSQNDTSYKQSVKEQFQQGLRHPVTDNTPPPAFSSKFSMDAAHTATPSGHTAGEAFNYNPYPNSMHQRVISPGGQAPSPQAPPANPQTVAPVDTQQPLQSAAAPVINEPLTTVPQTNTQAATPVPAPEPELPSEPPVSPDIMRLASNNDLSISAIAREAHRIEEKDDNEVVISLR